MIFNSNKYVWHDYSIEKINVEYNKIILELDGDSGTQEIIFENYIAIEFIGQWDENIIEAIYEEKDNDIISVALEKVKSHNNTLYPGGGIRNINSDWTCFVIKLLDGVRIKIVCDNVIVRE